MNKICKQRFDAVRQVMDERNKLYEERAHHQERAVETALAAVEKFTNLRLESQKEAANKLEQVQRDYNVTHNDLLRRMDKQYEEMMSRREYITSHENLRQEITVLRKELDRQEGEKEAKKASSDTTKWVIGLLVAVLLALLYHVATH